MKSGMHKIDRWCSEKRTPILSWWSGTSESNWRRCLIQAAEIIITILYVYWCECRHPRKLWVYMQVQMGGFLRTAYAGFSHWLLLWSEREMARVGGLIWCTGQFPQYVCKHLLLVCLVICLSCSTYLYSVEEGRIKETQAIIFAAISCLVLLLAKHSKIL